MIRFPQTLAVARAEARLTRRLVRYWVFVVLAFLVGTLGYLYYAALHAFFSSYSASVASIGPRYLIGAMGLYSVMVYMVGIIFLGFDLRARDTRERMTEVLDSRPLSNLELVVGRFLGLLIPSWIPVVVLAGFLDLLGHVLPALGSPVGEPMARLSLFTFATFMAVPAFSFALALVFLVSIIVRHRLVAAVLLFALLGGIFFALFRLPLRWTPFFDITGAYIVDFPSEVVPRITDIGGWLQRPGVLILALGMLGITAVLHPRLDGGSRSRQTIVSVLIMALGLGLMGGGSLIRHQQLNTLERWKAAHETRLGEAVPDIDHIAGSVVIDPGKNLELEFEVDYHAPVDADLESLLFSFNPGLEIESLEVDGREVEFDFADGLLDIALPRSLSAGAEGRLHLVSSGRPDLLFGYLDSAIVPESLNPLHGQIFLLGFDRGTFEDNYVALMPAIRWLPCSGPDVGREDTRTRPIDYFTVDLEVEVPEDFIVAGPGHRESLSATRFEFVPGAPLPEVALIASEFTSVVTEIGGIETELLLDPSHTKNLDVLDEAEEEIKEWVEERLGEIGEAGLHYPYTAFTMVEVPNSLRGYGGGWRVDTALTPPGMALIRESGFPTARFDVPFRKPEEFKDREGGVARAKAVRLRKFFENDFSGGNPFRGFARSLFFYQTSATGEDALALNFVTNELATLTVAESRGYFSAFLFSPEMQQAIGSAIQGFVFGGRNQNFADVVIDVFTSRPEVWSVVMDTSLRELEPDEDPQRTIDVLTLKAGALATSLVDEMGIEGAGQLLAELRTRYSGRTFTLDDVLALESLDETLRQLFTDWLSTTSLPAFVAEEATAYRIADGDDGSPRYQLSVTVRNDELTQGLLRVVYSLGEVPGERIKSDPIRLAGHAAVRFSTVVTKPPRMVWIEPYLSMNRDTFRVEMEAVDDEKIVDREALEGLEDLEWSVPESEAIVVDDLDEGFSITDDEGRDGVRLGAKEQEAETDQGLPMREFGQPPAEWSRATSASAWGRYRHTVAYIKGGDGKTSAVLTAEVPNSGPWELEIHLPNKRRFITARKWGVWTLEIDNNNDIETTEFDAAAATEGWNLVGSFELADGPVTVRLSNETSGQIVVADAVRWMPAAGNGLESGESE